MASSDDDWPDRSRDLNVLFGRKNTLPTRFLVLGAAVVLVVLYTLRHSFELAFVPALIGAAAVPALFAAIVWLRAWMAD